MAGGAAAVRSGDELRQRVQELAQRLGLDVQTEQRVGRRLWGSERRIDVILTDRETRKAIGLECKIGAWPIPGLVVFSGEGFTDNMRAYLHSTGKAVDFEGLEDRLKPFFGLKG